ncbi:MAG: hypothetical protein QOF41_715 [Methylobacteriaceae bacterium]|jgi:hypothetical protein|nr:hypothetical protein [Methylobacteriaceae bacterium]
MVMDQFQERLLQKIDQEIAEVERSIERRRALTFDAHPECDGSQELYGVVIGLRERRRRVRRSFLLHRQCEVL